MGARQTGKSTLVRTHPALAGRPYFTLDDALILADARDQPGALVRRAPELTLDEIQRAPGALLAVKQAVDEQPGRRPGQFVLTGSANLLLMRQVQETLAGRASYLTLWPLARREQLGLGTAGAWSELFGAGAANWSDLLLAQTAPPEDWRGLARRGGYPTPAVQLGTDAEREIWFGGYVNTYLQRDVPDLADVANLAAFTRLLRLLALRVGNILNITDLARDASLPRTTADRHLDVLETSYQFVRLESFATNATTRVRKAPKVYWSDCGLALHLSGLGAPTGAHLENLVLSDLLVWRDAQVQRPGVMYWRTARRQEIDFVVEVGSEVIAIEVKAGAMPTTSDARHLRAFQEMHRERVRGCLVLHDGPEVFQLAPGIVAAPWWRVI